MTMTEEAYAKNGQTADYVFAHVSDTPINKDDFGAAVRAITDLETLHYHESWCGNCADIEIAVSGEGITFWNKDALIEYDPDEAFRVFRDPAQYGDISGGPLLYACVFGTPDYALANLILALIHFHTNGAILACRLSDFSPKNREELSLVNGLGIWKDSV
ncbi:MAG: hypothetical protein ACE37H_03640 [Phycisphaeraceae bacterium]